MSTSNYLNGDRWNWDAINSGANNVGSLLNTGLDIFGSFKDTFGKNSNQNNAQQQQYTQTPQPIFIPTPTQTPQQAGLGIDNNTVLMVGGLLVAGMIVKSYLDNNRQVSVDR